MSFWKFLGGFALFNAVCDMFSSKHKRPHTPVQQYYHDYDPEDYLTSYRADEIDAPDVDTLQSHLDDLELQLAETDAMSERWDEIQSRIDELQDRIDCMEEWEDTQDELDDMRDGLDNLEFDRDLYADHDDW